MAGERSRNTCHKCHGGAQRERDKRHGGYGGCRGAAELAEPIEHKQGAAASAHGLERHGPYGGLCGARDVQKDKPERTNAGDMDGDKGDEKDSAFGKAPVMPGAQHEGGCHRAGDKRGCALKGG